METNYKAKIDGKARGMARLIMVFIFTIIFGGLSLAQLITNNYKFTVFLLFFLLMAIPSLWLFIKLLNRYLFFKVFIYEDGVSIQTNPFNKHYYEYVTIESCYEDVKTNTNGANVMEAYYFVLKKNTGEKIKFQYEPDIHTKEIQLLKSKITNTTEY